MRIIFETEGLLDNREQAVDFIRNLEIPCSLKLAECYQSLQEPRYDLSVKYCSNIIEKNIGICLNSPEDQHEILRCKAFYHRGKAYQHIQEYKLAFKDFERASKMQFPDNEEHIDILTELAKCKSL